MRSLILLLLVVAPLVLSKKHHDTDSYRLCPTGYRYAGDDTVEMNPRDVTYQEVSRTPMYSCYKLVSKRLTWLAATHACWNDDAQLVSFEDPFEMNRVLKMVQGDYDDDAHNGHDHDGDGDSDDDDRRARMNVFTSGMFFGDIGKWYWVGANKTILEDMTIVNQNTETDTKIRDCLRANLWGVITPKIDDITIPAADPTVTLSAASCFDTSYYMCEARVQTVTYVAWFTANWVDLLLGFLLVILFVALCISVCAYSSNDHGHRAAEQRRRHVGQRRPRTTDPDFPQVIDLPPSYDSTVKVHMPSNAANAATSATPSRIDYYRARGKELMARVYFYKETPAKK